MKGLILYRILTFILVPIAAILSLFALMAVLVALSNPALLLGAFMLACMIIYIFCSFKFLNKGILANQPCKHSLRDWIRVNAFVTIAFAFLSLFQSTALLSDPKLLHDTITGRLPTQSELPSSISVESLKNTMIGTLYFMVFLSVVLIIHIFITFRLLKVYKYLFDDNNSNNTTLL